MRYAVVVMLDSEDDPTEIADKVVSELEFESRTTVSSVVVLTEGGDEVAVYDRKEART